MTAEELCRSEKPAPDSKKSENTPTRVSRNCESGEKHPSAETALLDTEASLSDTETALLDTEAYLPGAETSLPDTEAYLPGVKAAPLDTETPLPNAEGLPGGDAGGVRAARTVCAATLSVRRASEGDLPFLLATEGAVFSDAWGEGGIRGQLSSPVGGSLILEADGAPVGYAFFLLMPPECEILRIAVSPAARRRGYGRALLAALLREAETGGASSVFLDVRAGNSPAIALYTAAGFAPTGRRRDFYRAPREDALLMERSFPLA